MFLTSGHQELIVNVFRLQGPESLIAYNYECTSGSLVCVLILTLCHNNVKTLFLAVISIERLGTKACLPNHNYSGTKPF